MKPLSIKYKKSKKMSMVGVLGHDSALEGYTSTGPVTTWDNEMNFVMNRA